MNAPNTRAATLQDGRPSAERRVLLIEDSEVLSRRLVDLLSDPGCIAVAAQDIMGIPRKGAGVEFLKQGLVDFGIRGPFVNDDVTHDELDAITLAIVGSFFLSGRYEALRGPSEDALIIPDLRASGHSGMVIGESLGAKEQPVLHIRLGSGPRPDDRP